MAIDCKKCGYGYCPVCKDKCPECGEIDIANEKTMQTRKQMKEHIDKNKKRYFAYGSNMDAEQILRRCPQSERQEKAKLSGFEFFINRRGVASIRRKASKNVWGIVYSITKNDEVSLDEYEGYPDVYKKERLSELNAFCYIDPTEESGSPRAGYMGKIVKAAQSNDFPKEYINELTTWLNQ